MKVFGLQNLGYKKKFFRGKTGDSNGVYSKGITIGHIINQVSSENFRCEKKFWENESFWTLEFRL